MGENRQSFVQRKFQITYVDSLRKRRWDISSHILSTGCASRLPSKEYSRKRGGKGVTLRWKRLETLPQPDDPG